MASTGSSSPSFRFRDLPSEIRKNIYRNLLCDFDLPPTTIKIDTGLAFLRAGHTIETGILRTNAEIHREAYDVMVKTNRFVQITSSSGFPLHFALMGAAVPVVAEDQKIVKRFKGYVLAISLKTQTSTQENPEESHLNKPCTLMILHRDLDRFCKALTDGDAIMSGFSENMVMTMMVAPSLFEQQVPCYRPVLQEYFSEKTQQALLAPFRIIRGYKNVRICGHVQRELASAVQTDMAQDSWSSPEAILTQYGTAKEEGTRLFQQRNFEEACLTWQDAALEIDLMHQGSSWEGLVAGGGRPFVIRIAELYFLIRLNVAHVQISGIQNPTGGFMGISILAEDALHSAVASLKRGFWMQDFTYRPSTKQLAKLHYRLAILLRLVGKRGTEQRALRYIDKALQLESGDAALLRERQNIMAWINRRV